MDRIISSILYFFEFKKASEWIEKAMIFQKIGNFLKSSIFHWVVGIAASFLVVAMCVDDNERKASDPAHRNDQYFSGWDGSNPELVEYVKAHMNDPNSFEHAETAFYEYDGGDKLRIKMTYRGKNAFGGVVTEQVAADLTKSSRMLSNINAY